MHKSSMRRTETSPGQPRSRSAWNELPEARLSIDERRARLAELMAKAALRAPGVRTSQTETPGIANDAVHEADEPLGPSDPPGNAG